MGTEARTRHFRGTDDQLMEALHREFQAVADAGHQDEDMSVVVQSFGS